MRFTSRMTWKHQGCLIDLEIPIIDCLSLKVLVWGRAISTIASNIDACPHHGQGLFFKLNYPHAQFACQVILCLIPGGNCKTLGFCVLHFAVMGFSGVARLSWLPGLSEILPGQAHTQTFLLGVLLKKCSNLSIVSKQNPGAAEVIWCVHSPHS